VRAAVYGNLPRPSALVTFAFRKAATPATKFQGFRAEVVESERFPALMVSILGVAACGGSEKQLLALSR